MISNAMHIAIDEIKPQLSLEEPITERLKKAMKLARKHWMVTNEDEQFRCAIGAVLLTANSEEQKLINEELNFLKTMSAAVQGIPVDIAGFMEGKDVNKWYHLKQLWEQSKDGETK